MALVFGTAGVAAANPVTVPDVTRTVVTPDGYHLSASLTNVTIESVPNMAATAFSREAFLSATATATIAGAGKEPVTGGKLELWFMAGCQIGMEGGGFLGLGSTVGISSILSNFFDLAAPKADVNPTSSLQLMPGRIAYELLSSKQIDPAGAQSDINASGQTVIRIDVTAASFKADACGGPVTVRLGVTARMSTRKNESESNAYGDNVNV
ncbi:MspA family porin [Mycolicibacterium pulveris]|uniref:MspA family porin n=1 Tax=Mycolicibacterium pulveris TaxID=36813 RepID=UPI003CFA9C3D